MTKAVQDRMNEVARIRDAFHTAIFVDGDVPAALAAATPECVVENVPAGGAAGDALPGYLSGIASHLPADLAFRRISRTGDRWRVAQEDMVSFTHDRELPWLLPGIAPTGREVEVFVMSVVQVERSLVAKYRILWDRASLTSRLHTEYSYRRLSHV